MHFYASRGTLEQSARLLARDCEPRGFLAPETQERLNLRIHPLEACHALEIGKYRVSPLPANHDPLVEPLIFAIEGNGGTILYATDTATFPESVWRAFHEHRLRFDTAIFDHTYGPEETGSDHLGALDVVEHARRMREEGLLAEDARILATHIAHEGNPAHPQLVRFAASHGYEVAFDGLKV
jgi:phosphoribosyl 1,2-cyclic phosphate phosphodiesterase